jgi:phytanoyl-CoA hydroxylase
VQISDLTAQFSHQGFVVVPKFASLDTLTALQSIAAEHLGDTIAPVEYEVDVQYPGAPKPGGLTGRDTVRRLLQAYARHHVFRDWAQQARARAVLAALLETPDVMLSQCHHNCVMTKQPGYSSATLWHRDNRYWQFEQANLVSFWLAVTDETRRNGCLRVIPQSHRWELSADRYDEAKFLRSNLAENKALLSQSQIVELRAGDAVFFHSQLFHAAGRNLTDHTKLSLVFTYHAADNRAIEGTRSARFPSILIGNRS